MGVLNAVTIKFVLHLAVHTAVMCCYYTNQIIFEVTP